MGWNGRVCEERGQGCMRGSECGGDRPSGARVVYMASVYVWIECTAAADTWMCVRSDANMEKAILYQANMEKADLRYVPHVSGQCECAVRFSGMES